MAKSAICISGFSLYISLSFLLPDVNSFPFAWCSDLRLLSSSDILLASGLVTDVGVQEQGPQVNAGKFSAAKSFKQVLSVTGCSGSGWLAGAGAIRIK